MSDFSIFNPKKSEKSDENQDAGGLQFHVDHPDPGIRRVRRRGARLFRTFSLRYFDFLLVFLIVTLNQITGMIASLVVMVLAAGMDYRRILHFGWFYYFVAIAALLAVRFMGDTGGGAQRWVTIGPLRFQPSEMAKVLIILFYAFFINKYKERVRTAPVTLMGIALIVPPLILVISQPDLSTTIMIFIIFCVIMFVGGINWKLVVGVLVVSVPSAAVLFNMILQDTEGKILDTYQRNRILAWIYPDQYQDSYAYQTINSVMAIGSGRLLGKGYNTNEISYLYCCAPGFSDCTSDSPDCNEGIGCVRKSYRCRNGCLDRFSGIHEYCCGSRTHSEYGNPSAVCKLWIDESSVALPRSRFCAERLYAGQKAIELFL